MTPMWHGLFHLFDAKWETVNRIIGDGRVTNLLGEGNRAIIVGIIQRCTECKRERAWIESNGHTRRVSPDYLRGLGPLAAEQVTIARKEA